YSVTVTDAGGCTATDTYTYVAPVPIDSVVVTTTPTGIPDDSTGTATANVFGGTAPYTYLWSNGGTTQTIDSLPAGTYCVTVTDANGCSAVSCGAVVQDTMMAPLMLEANANTPACGAGFGTATASATGGTPPYSYLWDNGETGPVADSLTAGTHTVTVTDAVGNTATDTVLVQGIATTLVIDAVVISPACAGGNNGAIVVQGSGGTPPYVFDWTPTASGDSLLNLAPGTYVVTMTDAANCKLIDTFIIDMIDSIGVTLLLTQASCENIENGVATANPIPATGNYSYSWNFPGQNGNTIFGIPGGTLIQVTVTDLFNGCSGTASGTVPTGTGPSVDAIPTNATCVGTNNGSALAQGAGGTPDYTYVWTVGADTLIAQQISGLAPGSYTVTATDANGCTAIDTVLINVASFPVAGFDVDAVCLPNFVNFTLTDQSTDSTNSIVQWDWTVTVGNDPPQNFAGQGPINFPVFTPGISVEVVLVVTSAAGCTDEEVITVIAPSVPPLTLELDNSPNCGGVADTITVLTDAGNTILFDPQTGLSPGPDPNTWIAQPDSQTTYTILASNGLCEASQELTITPAVSVEIDVDAGIAVRCDSVMLTAMVKNGLSAVVWLDSTGSIVGKQNPVMLPLYGATTYVVVAGDSQGCTDTATVVVKPEGVDVELSDDALSGCERDTLSVTLNNLDPEDTLVYNWSTNSPNLVIIGVPSNTVSITGTAGDYLLTVEVTNQHDCSQTFTIPVLLNDGAPAPVQAEVVGGGCSLSVNYTTAGALTGTWNFGDDNSAVAGDTLYTYEKAGVYNVSFMPNAACMGVFDTVINLYTIAMELTDTSVCAGVPVALNPSGDTNYQYTWSAEPNDPSLTSPGDVSPVVVPQQTTTYSALVTYGTCTDTVSTTVTVLQGPALTVSDTSAVCFAGQPLTLTAQSPATPEWSNNPTFDPVIGSGLEITVDNPSLGSYYYVRSVGANDCASMDSILAINAAVGLSAQNGVVCAGGSTQLQLDNINPWQTLTYVWNPAVGDSNWMVSPDTNTVYTVTATNSWGCTAEASVFIGVQEVQAGIAVDGGVEAVYEGGSVTMFALPNESGYTYAWSPADAVDNPTGQSTTATLQEETTFVVTVTDPAGCSDTAMVTIRVGPCEGPYIFVPKAFTPNDDGNNDYFRVRAIDGQIGEIYFTVFSRWGEKMYETNDVNHQGWDGRWNGDIQTPDTYGWYLEVRCPGGEKSVLKGNVTLIR
ncbi:MAG: gliding motility-associated C-terminal domain-containing protein, partial [Saprospiraceae bacterium]|nr:gliding motility-associated C-terminal domain-containing protein [Saprospiraceae bacterium]